jgi:glutathione S-transferase
VLRLHAIPFSTNVERITLALAYKGLQCELVEHDPDDRSAIVRRSGQELVPVLEDDGEVVSDSPLVLRHLERKYPQPPLWPTETARSAELDLFLDWFNRVWKRPPNAIADGIGGITEAAELRGSLGYFEALLAGRPFLFGDGFTAADATAFPFIKYGLVCDPADDEPFHRVLIEHLSFGDDHPRLTEWVRRVDAMPRAGDS